MRPKAVNESDRIAHLTLARSENVGPVTFHQLLKIFGSAHHALAELPALARNGGLKREISVASMEAIENELQQCRKIGARIILWGESDYPIRLQKIADAPPVLTALGELSRLNEMQGVAVVGSRSASVNAIKFCEQIVSMLANYNIVSGLALGVDAAAHRKASFTTAVVAGGVDYIYPQQNRQLYHQILEKGVVLSEAKVGCAPVARAFPKRNRIISGISDAVLVIEAAMKSGTLITARNAAEQGRPVFAVPGSPMDPRAAGANMLLKSGAKLLESAQDVIEFLKGHQQQLHAPANQSNFDAAYSLPRDAELAKWRPLVAGAIGASPTKLDDLEEVLEIPCDLLNYLVLELELAGQIERGYGLYVRRVVF